MSNRCPTCQQELEPRARRRVYAQAPFVVPAPNPVGVADALWFVSYRYGVVAAIGVGSYRLVTLAGKGERLGFRHVADVIATALVAFSVVAIASAIAAIAYVVARSNDRPGPDPEPVEGADLGDDVERVGAGRWLRSRGLSVPTEPRSGVLQTFMRHVINDGDNFTQSTVRRRISGAREFRLWYNDLRDLFAELGWATDTGNGYRLTDDGRAVARAIAVGGQPLLIRLVAAKIDENISERSAT